MASLNKVMLIGNLTRDPELRFTPKGTAVVDLGLAVNRRFTVEGEQREEVAFLDITFWGRQAEVINQYMQKGNPMFVEGRLQMDSWQDKNTGQNRYKLKIVGENFQFLAGRSEGGGGGGGQNYAGGDYNQPTQHNQQSQGSGGYSPPPQQEYGTPPRETAPSQSDPQPEPAPVGGGGGGGPMDVGEEDDEIPF